MPSGSRSLSTGRFRERDGRVAVKPSSDTEFVLKFAGRPDDISARTFLESLHGIATVIQEANRELGTGDPLDVRIRAPRPGSFLVNLLLDPATVSTIAALFTAHNLEIAKSLVDVLVAAIDLRKFLKGEKPASVTQQGSTVAIQNSSGNTIIQDNRVYNFIVNNPVANAGLDRAFGALNGDPNVTEFAVLNSNEKELTTVPRDDFADMSSSGALLQGTKRSLLVRAQLSIVKLSFEPNLKWEFVYNGIKIAALIEDPTFWHSIDARREAFMKGDTLDVDLRIQQEYDEKTKAFMNRGYSIATVHRHVALDEQRKLLAPIEAAEVPPVLKKERPAKRPGRKRTRKK